MSNSELDAALQTLDNAANLDLSGPLRTTARLVEQETRNTFRSQSDPWGHPWPPHAESTKKSRLRKGNTRTSLLIDRGDMYDSIRNESGADYAQVSIDGPAEVHQDGTHNAGHGHSVTIPPRPMFPMHSGVVDLPQGYIELVTAPLVTAFMGAFK